MGKTVHPSTVGGSVPRGRFARRPPGDNAAVKTGVGVAFGGQDPFVEAADCGEGAGGKKPVHLRTVVPGTVFIGMI